MNTPEKLAILSLLAPIIASCSPARATHTPDHTGNSPPQARETLESNVIIIGPNEKYEDDNYSIVNEMSYYGIWFDRELISNIENKYGIPVDPADSIVIRITPEIFPQEESAGVLVNGNEIIISGGLFEALVFRETGRLPSDSTDQNFLSAALSIKLLFGLSRIAEQRGELPPGSAYEIEHMYADDIINNDARHIAGMKILPQSISLPEFDG